MRIEKELFSAVPQGGARASVQLAFAIAALSAIAGARQTTDFVSLTWQGLLPSDGASGSVAAFGISADGQVIAFHSFASDLVPGLTSSPGHTYVRDRRHATTYLASVSTSGVPGNGQSIPMDVSWDGRWVLYRSGSTNLDPLDLTIQPDVFLHDHETSTTSIVSLGTGGLTPNASAGYSGAVSGDGRLVVFDSYASNLTPSDGNGLLDVFMRDQAANTTTLVSVSLSGVPGNGESARSYMSDDGRFVVFSSTASNLVAGDTNGKRDIFLRDMNQGTTTLVSVGIGGAPANHDSFEVQITNDGRYVAFESWASNLVAGDTGHVDVFLRDLVAGTTARVSEGLNAVELNHDSDHPTISADGAYVAFSSRATNHGFADSNGYDVDVFLYHVPSATLSIESLNVNGSTVNAGCLGPMVSADGRCIVFSSAATTLGPFQDLNNYVDTFVRDARASETYAYCTAKTSSGGCVASMSGEGVASASAPASFFVRTSMLGNQKPGLVFFGFAPTVAPFQGGTMCVALPHVRTLIQHSGGDAAPAANCSGALTVDFNAVIQSGATPQLAAGAIVFCQAWYRDPPGLFHSALSDALRFPVLP